MCLGTIGSIMETFDEGGMPMAAVRTELGDRHACLLYCPDAVEGDHVLLHMGFVMEVLDESRAAEALRLRGAMAAADVRSTAAGE